MQINIKQRAKEILNKIVRMFVLWFSKIRLSYKKIITAKSNPEKPAHHIILKYHKIYLLPTRHGLRFFAIVLVLILGSINYENNLGLLFSFLLVWVALISVLHTYRNLAGIKCESGINEPAFAGQDIYYKIELQNQDDRNRETIRIRWKNQNRVSVTLGSYEKKMVEVPISLPKRGLFNPGKFRIYTQFPLGLFYAWSWIEFDTKCVVYPKPIEKKSSFQRFYHRFFKEGVSTEEGREDFGGFRKYQPGDSLKHVAWKASARGDEVLTKEFLNPTSSTLWLNFKEIPIVNVEDKLSLLCRAILESERLGHHYGLMMPNEKINPGLGETHKHKTLKQLAVFGESL